MKRFVPIFGFAGIAAAAVSLGAILVLAQGGTSRMPQYRMVVPPLPPMSSPRPADVPGPKAPDWGTPQAPGVDNYYLDGNPDEWWPDEFRSNPDPDINLSDLKGYHFPPILRWITVDKRSVKAGETIKGQAMVEDQAEVPQWAISFEGPRGRRTSLNMRFVPRKDNPMIFDGELTIPKWAEPGVYIPYSAAINNIVGHSKGYFPEYLPAMKDLVFEVGPNPDADVTPPSIDDFGIGLPGKSTAEGAAQAYRPEQPITVWAKVTDNKSGVRSVTARILSPKEKFKEVKLQRWMGKTDYWIGQFKVPKHYEAGEYYTTTVWAADNATQEFFTFYRTNPKVKAARFALANDPAMVDSNSPELINAWLDKSTGNLGDTVKISVVVSDVMAGVEAVTADLAAYPSFADKRRVQLKKAQSLTQIEKPGFNIDQNVWEGTFTTHKMDEPGDWKLVRVFARDAADNLMDVRREEHPELLTVSVNLKGGVRNLGASNTFISSGASAQPAAAPAAQPAQPGKIRRVDMTPPHPPRGACLNCHEP